ncbi:MAG: 50S ribosomal protein L29 [Gammaproteobacteria bacterium]|jgi:large subunit ribosomal protein L29
MKLAETLRGKDIKALTEELVGLRKEQFNLRMQTANKQTHEKKRIRRTIARIKTILVEKGLHV